LSYLVVRIAVGAANCNEQKKKAGEASTNERERVLRSNVVIKWCVIRATKKKKGESEGGRA